MILLKNTDKVLECDENFSYEEVDTLEKMEDDLSDTIELSITDIEGAINDI